MYTNRESTCKLVKTKSIAVDNIMFECVTVELSLKNLKKIIVNCMYRTPGSCLDTFCENIETILCDAKSVKTIFMCGDLNIDLLKHEEHSGTKHFLDMKYSFGLYPLTDKPTRITQSSATLIDNIFTNEM